jgi:hypothetical protein
MGFDDSNLRFTKLLRALIRAAAPTVGKTAAKPGKWVASL